MALFARVMALFLAFAAPAHSLVIELHDAEISDCVVQMGKIANFGEVSHTAADKLADIVVAYAPPAGTTKNIPVETIRLAAMRLGYLPNEINISGNGSVVTRRSQTIEAEKISDEIQSRLKPLVPADATIQVQRISQTKPMPEGKVEFEISFPQKLERTIIVPVTVRVGNESLRINAVVKVSRFGKVFQASRRIERGEVIAESDIQEKNIDLYEMPHGAVMVQSEIIGSAAARTIAPSTVIINSSIERNMVVRRGDEVKIKVMIPGVEVVVKGTSCESGALGEVVKVKNQTSGRIISGRVISAGEVMIVE